MDDPVTPTSYLANEINEINDSCKWSFTVPNFYVKFSTLPLPPGSTSTLIYIHASLSLLRRNLISVGFNAENPCSTVISPSPYNIEMLHDRRAEGGKKAQDRGRNSRSEIFRRRSPVTLNRRKPYPSRAPRVRAVKASGIGYRCKTRRPPSAKEKNSIDRGRRCVARAPEIPHDPGDTTLSFAKGSACI